MKLLRLLLCIPLLAACATLSGRSREDASARRLLWIQAFDAYSRDSVKVAKAMFQRLATDHPRTHEGHEARYFLGVLSLDPRGGADARAAEENLRVYLADDSVQSLRGTYRREATSLLGLAHEIRSPCASRTGGLGCDTTVVARPVAVPVDNSAAAVVSAAELARWRRMYSERGDTIRDLRAELERIRNTLAPRRP